MSRKIHSSAIFMVCVVFCLRLSQADPQKPISQSTEDSSSSTVPQLLLDIYDCWNGDSPDCLPIADPEVNVVRTILGHVDENPPPAVQSFNGVTRLNDSVAMKFDSSKITGEVVHAAVLRVPKRAFSIEEITSLKSECNLSNLKVLLYSTLPDDAQVVVLEKKIPLSQEMLEEDWFTFTNITEPLRHCSHDSVILRLAIESGCSFTVDRLELGQKRPEIVAYMKSDVEDTMLSDIVNEERRRKRREVSKVSEESMTEPPTKPATTNMPTTTDTTTTETTTTETTTSKSFFDYTIPECQLHDFIVDFAAAGLSHYIIQPPTYNARLCAGTCSWPVIISRNHTRHSFLQSLINFKLDGVVPPPCCAPHPETMGTFAVVIRENNDNYVTRKWSGMVANSCACL